LGWDDLNPRIRWQPFVSLVRHGEGKKGGKRGNGRKKKRERRARIVGKKNQYRDAIKDHEFQGSEIASKMEVATRSRTQGNGFRVTTRNPGKEKRASKTGKTVFFYRNGNALEPYNGKRKRIGLGL